jgi:hypothetical protein
VAVLGSAGDILGSARSMDILRVVRELPATLDLGVIVSSWPLEYPGDGDNIMDCIAVAGDLGCKKPISMSTSIWDPGVGGMVDESGKAPNNDGEGKGLGLRDTVLSLSSALPESPFLDSGCPSAFCLGLTPFFRPKSLAGNNVGDASNALGLPIENLPAPDPLSLLGLDFLDLEGDGIKAGLSGLYWLMGSLLGALDGGCMSASSVSYPLPSPPTAWVYDESDRSRL